ncbi:MAG: FAD-binding protein [Polyangiaceae bacterium]|nr:FAD-binding protein [Polyangiaceae bacterium]
MSHIVTNYDGGITAAPRAFVQPTCVEEIQAILRDRKQYPSPVRAMGSYHSLTPCASSNGTMVSMARLNRVVNIDRERMLLTAEAGIHVIDASKALRAQGLQFRLNIEIGNMTLGSAACCHSKDALDGVEYGQFGSYLWGMKWVDPSGELREANEDENPDLLRFMRASHGLSGIVVEVTFHIEPEEGAELTYLPRPVSDLTADEVNGIIDRSEGLICWTVRRTSVFQTKKRIDRPGMFATVSAEIRHKLWNYLVAYTARNIEEEVPEDMRKGAMDADFSLIKSLYELLHRMGGITIHDADKTIDYRDTEPDARYVFTFWSFPRAEWLRVLREYLDFADLYFQKHGFRCNMPLGSYYIRRDDKSLLSYSADGDTFSIDPIHAPTDRDAWNRYLDAFNEFAFQRGGTPLLNQSPRLTRAHVQAAYGERWNDFSARVRAADPEGRMLNPFFAELLAEAE